MEQDKIKQQEDLEVWLKSQCEITGVDPLRVRVAASIVPRFLIEPVPSDFPGEGLLAVAEQWHREQRWWYEVLHVAVLIEGVQLAADNVLVPAGSVPTLADDGEVRGKYMLSKEDRRQEWLQLAAGVVGAAGVRLGLLRGVEISWPVAPVADADSLSSPLPTTSESSPAPS